MLDNLLLTKIGDKPAKILEKSPIYYYLEDNYSKQLMMLRHLLKAGLLASSKKMLQVKLLNA